MLKLTTFGGLSLARDGQPMTGAAAQRSRLALLALLASAGPAGISRDKLLLYLWPESDSERARHALKQAVYALRRDLGDEETIQGTASLCLNPALIESDVREFEAALAKGDRATAVALYTGAFLDGVYLKEAPEFERWCAEMRTRLSQDWAKAVEGLARDCEAKGEWRDAVGRWRQLAAAEPLSGRNTMLLMRALAESGDTSAALAQYRVHESLMQQEMESTPDREVAKLADDMKQGRWQRSAPVAMATPVTPSVAQAPAAPAPVGTAPSTPAVTAPLPARRRTGRWIGVAAIGLALLTTGFVYSRSETGRRTLSQLRDIIARGAAPKLHNTILIAPFTNETGDVSLNKIALGVPEMIRRGLNNGDIIKVVTGLGVKGTAVAVEKNPFATGDEGIKIARELGIDTLLQGAIRLRGGDSVEIDMKLVDAVTGQTIRSIPLVHGRSRPDALLVALMDHARDAAVVTLYGMLKKSPSAGTAAFASTPNPDIWDAIDQGYFLFFSDVSDTGTVFKMFDRAASLAPDFAGAYVMKAYMRDVKGNWPGLAEMIPNLESLRPSMTRAEQKALDMYEADLTGRPYDRLRAAHDLTDASPGQPEMPILCAVSHLYVGHADSALAEFARTDDKHGINLGSPVYWGWLAVAQHFANDSVGERKSVKVGMERFPRSRLIRHPLNAVYARTGDTAEIIKNFELPIKDDGDPLLARRELMLHAARELRAHGHADMAPPIIERALAEIRANRILDSERAAMQEATALYELGKYAEAKALFAAIHGKYPNNIDALGRLGAIAARMKDAIETKQIDNQLKTLHQPYMLGRNIKWRAHIAAIEKRTSDAIDLLDAATKAGYRLMDSAVIDIHHDVDFVELTRTPAYREFLKMMGSSVR